MKKKHLTYAKKTLSVFLTVLMLMSAWVWVAPEKAEAAYSSVITDLLNGITDKTFDTGFTTVSGTFIGGKLGDGEMSSYSHNLIYSPLVGENTDESPCAVRWSNVTLYRNNNYIRYFFANTVMIDDGKTDPFAPVVMTCTANTANYLTPISGYISNASAGIVLGGQWTGDQTSNNVERPIYASSGTQTGKITTDGSTGNYQRMGKSIYNYGNTLKFTGTVSSDTYYSVIQPQLCWIGGNNNTEGKQTLTPSNSQDGKVNRSIYVLKYDTLETAIKNAKTMYQTILSNPDQYAYKSVKNFVACANALLAARPKNYITTSTAESNLANQVAAYGSAAKSAVNTFNSFKLETKTQDVTFENIFSISDWMNSKSFPSHDASFGEVTVEGNNTIKIYKLNTGGELTTGSSYSGDHQAAMYSMPVIGGKDYTVRFDTGKCSVTGSVNSEIFMFWYDSNNKPVYNTAGTNTFNNQGFSGEGAHSATFTAPATAVKAEIRFDNDCPSNAATIRFTNIAVYPADRGTEYDIESWTTRPVTKAYNYNAALGATLPVPERTGYDFNGWYLDGSGEGAIADGKLQDVERVTDGNGTVVSGTQSFPIGQHYNLYADWIPMTMDVGYDNLFSLSEWSKTGSVNPGGGATGTVDYDLTAGTITVESVTVGTNNEVYTSYGSDGYTMDVEPNTEYVFEVDLKHSGTTKNGQMFIFCYDANGNATTNPGPVTINDNGTETSNNAQHIGKYLSSDGTHTIKFRTPANCYKLRVRVGATDVGTKATYSNIGIYKLADYDAYAKNYAKVREPFKLGETKSLLGPTRDGWVFDGWTLKDGTKITDTSGLSASTTVYANWTKLWTVTYYDGDQTTVLATTQVKDGQTVGTLPSVTPTKASDATNKYDFEYWYANSAIFTADTVVTGDVKVFSTFKKTEHTFVWAANTYKGATCTEPALVRKYCKDCGYNLGNVPYDGDNVNWLAKGHDYSRGEILADSSTGNTDSDTHSIKCAGYSTCGSVDKVKHEWQNMGTDGATCTTPGTVHWQCACKETKTTTGTTAPDVHNYDLTEGTSNGDNKTHTVKCTYNPDHTKSVDCTDNNNDCKCDICAQQLIHVYDQQTRDHQASPADCYNDAVYYLTCKCGDVGTGTWKDVGSMLDHDWTDTETNLKSEADCENDEVYYKECSLCKASSEGITDSTWTKAATKKGHNYTDYDEVKSLDNGKHSYLCKNGCGTYGYEGVKGEGKDCDYGEWSKTETDTHTKKCTECSYSVTEDHDWTAWTSTDEDNAAAGQHTRSCEVCDRAETENCTYTSVETKVTCTEDGYTTHTCATCKHDYVTAGATKTGHNYTAEAGVQSFNDGTHNYLCANECGTYGVGTEKDAKANCTYKYDNIEAGKHQATCTVCKYTFAEECSGGEATCTAPATCEKCEKSYGNKAPHSFTGTAVQLDGDKHAYRCKFCNDQTIYGVGEKQNETEDCSGGTATCIALAVCDVCKDTHGGYASHVYNGDAVKLDGDEHAYRCSVCKNENLYGVGNEDNATEPCSGGTPTCTDEAECTVCKDTHGEINADAHKWGEWINNKDTETHTRTCEYDAAHTQTEECYSSGKAIVEADCEAEGYDLNTCDFCNHQWKSNIVPALGHDWSDWVSDDEGGHSRVCERAGCHYADDHTAKTETGTCTKENAVADVTLPDCLTGGHTTYTCKDCGYEWVDDYTAPTGHSYDKKRQKTDSIYKRSDKDCTTDWTYWYCCDNCDVSAETEVDKYENLEDLYWVREVAAGHKYDDKTATQDYIATPATCTDKASYYYSCSVCGASSKDTDEEATFTDGKALGHDWQNTETFKKSDSDCINNEVYYKECSRCHISSEDETDETWEKTGTLAGHDFDHDDDGIIGNEGDAGYTAGVEAECLKDGMVEHYTCQTCGKHFRADKTTEIAADKLVIPELKHDYKDIPAKAANCEEDGYTKHKQCQRCDTRNIDYKVIPATGHDFKAENGYYCDEIYNYHAFKCTNCECYGVDGVKYSVDSTDLDPVFEGGIACSFTGEYVNYEDENGAHSHKLTCVCGNVQSDVCADEDGAEYTEPECGVNGYYTYVCTVCDYTWTVEDADSALDHDYEGATWSKVEGKDEHIRYCKNGCGGFETEACYTENPLTGCGVQNVCDTCGGNFGEFTEHKWVEVEEEALLKDAATCTTNAVYYKKCSNCGEASTELTWTKSNSKLGHAMSEYGYSTDGWKDANGNSLAPEGFDASIIKEPTCCTEGVQISYCSRCDVYKTKRVPADASKHQWEKDTEGNLLWVPVSGDCSTGITMTNRCTVEGCGKTQSKVEYDVEHTYEVVYVEYPTCKDEGARVKKCVLCGETVNEHYNQETGLPADLKPTGEHTYEEISTTPATCIANAYKTLQCKVCQDTITEEIADTMLEHTYIEYGEAAPSCEANGYSAYKKCTDCGVEEGKTIIEALGHTDADGDGKCDECYRVLFETDDGEKSCGCICHKENFLMKFIYKILNFFWKLFKISKSCDCGAVHW